MLRTSTGVHPRKRASGLEHGPTVHLAAMGGITFLSPFRRPLGSQSVAGLWQVSPNSCSALMRALAQAARSARCNLTFSRLGLVKGPFVLYHETLVVGGAPTRGPAPEYDTRANMDRHIVTHRTPTRHRITSASSTARLGRLQHKPLLTPRLHSFRKVSASSPRARAPAL